MLRARVEDIAEGLLKTDICTIAEDDQAIVMAVRVSKKTIEANRRLFVEVAELSGLLGKAISPPAMPAPAPITDKPRRRPRWQTVATAVLLSPIAMAANWSLTLIQLAPATAAASAPVEVASYKAEAPAIRLGEPLWIVAHMRRSRLCSEAMDRIIVSAETGSAVTRERINGLAQPIGDVLLRRRFPIAAAAALPPGAYILRSFHHSDCGAQSHFAQRPDVPFEVLP